MMFLAKIILHDVFSLIKDLDVFGGKYQTIITYGKF